MQPSRVSADAGARDQRGQAPARESFLTRAQAGRLAALLYLGASVAGLVALPFPQPAGSERGDLLLVVLAAMATGIVCWFAPWSKWPRWATLAIVPPSLALIAMGNALSGSIPFTYSLFFVVLFVWIGASQRSGMALAAAPLALVAYVAPLPLLTAQVGAGLASALVVIPTCVLVGESLAWAGARFARNTDALLRTEERFRLLVEAIDDSAIVMLDPDGYVASWNAGAERIFGYEGDEVIGRHSLVFHATGDVRRGVPSALLLEAAERGRASDEGWRMRKDGTRFFANVFLTALREPDGTLGGFANVTRDVTERRDADEAIRRTVEALQQMDGDRRLLLSRLVRAQEEERRRVAADIHDDTVQVMSAVAMRLDLVERRVTDPDLHDVVSDSAALVHAAIDRLRRMIFALHPPALDDEGLAAAVAAFVAEEEATRDGPPVRIESHLTREPGHDVRVLAYRIIQEALMNAYKHSAASEVHVLLRQSPDGLVVIRVRDDGRGFPMGEEHRSVAGHIGLAAMREHAKVAGGRCIVRSEPGEGTTVDVWLPLDEPAARFTERGRIAS
jgi:PAS domain S-box-containing protein